MNRARLLWTACLLAPAIAAAQGKKGDDAPHWADNPAKKPAAESREGAMEKIKAAQEAQRQKAERAKADKENAQRAAEEAKRKQAEEAEKHRLAALEGDKEAKRKRAAMEARCEIKPVMTDADMEACRELAR